MIVDNRVTVNKSHYCIRIITANMRRLCKADGLEPNQTAAKLVYWIFNHTPLVPVSNGALDAQNPSRPIASWTNQTDEITLYVYAAYKSSNRED